MIAFLKSLFRARPKKRGRVPSPAIRARGDKIAAAVRSGVPRKEVAAQFGVSEVIISQNCRKHGIIGVRGRPAGFAVGYGRKITREQWEWAIQQDRLNVPHATIGKALNVSRERVRQICESAGNPTRRSRQRIQSQENKERLRAEKLVARALRKATPSDLALAASVLWNDGVTTSGIAQRLGKDSKTIGVQIHGKWRHRWPNLFPYRRPAHLRWKGINMRQWPGYERPTANDQQRTGILRWTVTVLTRLPVNLKFFSIFMSSSKTKQDKISPPAIKEPS